MATTSAARGQTAGKAPHLSVVHLFGYIFDICAVRKRRKNEDGGVRVD